MRGEKALYETGKQFGKELMQQHMHRLNVSAEALTIRKNANRKRSILNSWPIPCF